MTAGGRDAPGPARPVDLLGPGYSFDFAPVGRARRPFPHLPALDGLRGLAVLAVLCFHGDWRWAAGGFLGVSTFFTLSGYLITARLVHDLGETGRVDLRAFWGRRIRRLLPAAVTTVAFVVILAATLSTAFRDHLAGDVVAALTNLANWRFWAEGRSYASLFSTPSPLLHFWSLAIEEQFYLVFPLLAWVLLIKLKLRRRGFTATILGLTVVTAGLSTLAGMAGRSTLVYYATPLRSAEILVGCSLALIPLGRPAARWSSRNGRLVPVFALAAMVLLWVATTKDMRWLDQGGLPAYSLLSAVVVLGCVRAGPVQRLLSVRPLRWLGGISYGLYLYHWPLFLLFNQQRVRLDAAPRFALQVAVSVGAAILSHNLLERPIMLGGRPGWVRHRRIGLPLAVGMAAVLATSILVDSSDGAAASGFPPSVEQTRRRLSSTSIPKVSQRPTTTAAAAADPTTTADAATAEPATTTTNEPAPPVRISVFGDSTALLTGGGLDRWGHDLGVEVDIKGTELGCGIMRGGRYRVPGYGEGPPRDECNTWPTRWASALAERPADVALVLVGTWDVTDHQVAGESEWRAPGDPAFDVWLKREMFAVVDELSARVPTVAWLTCPLIDFNRTTNGISPHYAMSDPARMVRFNELLREVAAERPNLRVVDLAGFLATAPGGELDRTMRPDGVHLTEAAAIQVAQWLGPQLVAAVRG